MQYQSPISPGISIYEATLTERPIYPKLEGWYTGLKSEIKSEG